MPKCLISIDNKTLLERIINASQGFNKVIVVGGYKINLIKKIINNKKNIYIINNRDFKTTNMVESFFKAYNKIDNDVIITYSDILFDQSLFKKMISLNKNHILLKSNWRQIWRLRMSEKKLKLDAEDIKTKKNEIISIGGKIEKKLPKYQFMGLIRINYNNLEKVK